MMSIDPTALFNISYGLYVLTAHDGQRHCGCIVNSIMQLTEKLSRGEVTIGSGTMYGATSNMMKKGWIKEIMSDGVGMERKRLYCLTEAGEAALEAEIARLKRMLEGV